jgi:uncharacterized protein (DUF1499 family)
MILTMKNFKKLVTLFFLIITYQCSGSRPDKIGVIERKLIPCPETPNCVNSQAPKDDSHYIDPIPYTSTMSEEIQKLKKILTEQPRTNEIVSKDDYLYFEFTSALMRYVDDVEFYLDDSSKLIHIRSASRLGKSDLGVNRKRIETIRELLKNTTF